MKDVKRRLNLYSFFDFPTIEGRLEKLAAKGWMLVKADSALWKYRRMEPKKLHFAITYFPKATNIDPEPSEELRTLWEFCERTGWKLAAQSAQLQIFYNEEEDPVPLETDPVIQVDNIHRAAFMPLLAQGILFLMGFLNLARAVSRAIQDPVSALSSAGTLTSGVCWLLVMLTCAVEAGAYFSWHRRAKAAAEEEGRLLPPRGTHRFQACMLAAAAALLAYWALTSADMPPVYVLFGLGYGAALVFGVQGMMKLLKRLKAPVKVNIAVSCIVCFLAAMILVSVFTRFVIGGRGAARLRYPGAVGTYMYDGMEWAVYDDELPLTLEELTGEAYGGYNRRRQQEGTILLERIECYQIPRYDQADFAELPELSYTIVKVKAGFLYDRVEEAMLAEDDRGDDWMPEGQKALYEPADPAPWGADAAYRLVDQEYGPREQYLLCYEDRLASIDLEGVEFTPLGAALIGERLRGA